MMLADETKISATRSGPNYNYDSLPMPQEKPPSPWLPFIVSFALIVVTAAGLFFYMNGQFKEMNGQFKKIETSILKTNTFVLDINQRLKKIEGDIVASDLEAEQTGSSLTTKVINLESRLSEAEKSVSSSGSRITKQISDVEGIQSRISQLSDSISTQASKIASNTSKIEELANQEDSSEVLKVLTQKVGSNDQNMEQLRLTDTRLNDAIQKVQADIARLIRIYEKDNPTATRVQ